MTDQSIVIFGFGYTAICLAKKLATLNVKIMGTSRDSSKHGHYHEAGFELVDFTETAIVPHIQSATHILITAPPSAAGDPVLANFAAILAARGSQIGWLGYLSSTGVYGDHQGRWVDESSASIGLSQQSQLRLQAENAWTAFAMAHRLPLHIFRIAGIYGPKRNALTRLAAGKQETVYKEGHFFSRIHVEDIASTLLASMNNPLAGAIYNIADDEPAPSEQIDEYASRLLNIPAPKRVPFALADLSPMANDFYTHNRRVSNKKIKQELLVTLKFPTYREGLTHLLQSEEY